MAAAVFAVLVCGTLSVLQARAASPMSKFDRPAPGSKMNLQAGSMDYDKTGQLAIATGNVIITYGNYILTADKVTYDKLHRMLTASGNVRLKEPNGTVFNTDYIELSDSFRDAFTRNLSVLLTNQAIVTARSARRIDGQTTVYNDATYSRCRACKEHPDRPLLWQFDADRVIHDEKSRTLKYENPRFLFLGKELVRMRSFSHADPTVSRRTGFLPPTFVTSDEFGFGVEIPYFLNLAPNYDLTLYPTLTTRQGPLLKTTWRHRIWNGQYSITPIGVYQFTNDPETPSDSRARGSISTKGHFAINDYWHWGWEGTAVSDDTFLRRYNIDKATDITSQVYLTGITGRNYLGIRAYHFRGLLKTDDNDKIPYVLPIIDHSYFLGMPVLGGEVRLNNNFMSLHRDTGPTSTRMVSTLQWQKQMVSSVGAVVTPFASVRGDVYFENGVPIAGGGVRNKDTIARVLPTAGLDMRMPFIKTSSNGYQQIFEPVAQILLRPDEYDDNRISNEDAQVFEFEETNLFNFNKFNGLDRWEGGSRINAGFNYTWLLNSGHYAKLTIGESFQLFGRNSFAKDSGLETDRSDFIASLQLKPSRYLNLVARARLDEDTLEIRRTDISAIARYGRFTTSMLYTDVDSQPALGEPKHREEIYGRMDVTLSKRWKSFAYIRYDIQNDTRINNGIGFKYDDECFTFQLQYQEDFTKDRDIDPERSVMLRFELKTIATAGFGGKLDKDGL